MRKCGNCRYYLPAAVPKSGYCDHPALRRDDDLVLVRERELACRTVDDWDRWKPGVPRAYQPTPVPLPAGLLALVSAPRWDKGERLH